MLHYVDTLLPINAGNLLLEALDQFRREIGLATFLDEDISTGLQGCEPALENQLHCCRPIAVSRDPSTALTPCCVHYCIRCGVKRILV